MITKITGKLLAIGEATLTLEVDAFEYEILIPEFTRRQLQNRAGEIVSLHNGRVFAGQNPPGGSIFTVILPRDGPSEDVPARVA